MDFTQFISENLMTAFTLVFAAGGAWFMLRSLSHRMDDQDAASRSQMDMLSSKIEQRFDKLDAKDDHHEERLSQHETRIAVAETKLASISKWTDDLKAKLDEIYRYVMEGSR